jgi:short-subunit dehydrogenase
MDSSNRPVALVTGASSGIGAELAREAARHGHDLILSARRLPPMETLAAELRGQGATVTVIVADLARPDAAASLVQEIAARGLSVDVLINNAGLGAAGRFDRSDPVRIDEMMQVNIVALTELTRLLLPDMVARRRGKVMLVASTASFLPGPGMAVYFASKAYVRSFGEALAEELRGSGVAVSALCPGATATEFFAVSGADRTPMARNLRRLMPADTVARIGWQGLARGKRVVIAGVLNRIYALAARLTPHALTLPLTYRMMGRD